MKKCLFKECEAQVPEGREVCDNCCFELHVTIRALQGISREAARVEWERENELKQN